MNPLRTMSTGFALLASLHMLEAGGAPGAVVGWGENTSGQAIGLPSPAPSTCTTGLVTVAGDPLKDAVAVAAGHFHGLALRSNGTVVGWGSNHAGQATGTETPELGVTNGPVLIAGKLLSNVVAIAAGNFSLALKSDGTLVAWGRNKVPRQLTNVAAIDARGFDSLAVKRDGTVFGWRSWPWGATYVPPGLTNVAAAVVGGGENYLQNFALTRDGTVVAWGNESASSKLPSGLSNVVAVAAGYNHTLALKADGTVLGWGYNRSGQATGVPTPREPHVSSGLVALNGHTLSNIVSIAAADGYSLAVKNDGSIVAWGEPRAYSPVPSRLSGVTRLVAGRGFCLAITTNAASFAVKK